MNIYVTNCPNTFNYGSMMMAENFIKEFNANSRGTHNYYLETTEKVNTERLIKATGYKQIFPVKIDAIFKDNLTRYDYLLGYFGLKNNVGTSILGKTDLIIVLGGDDYTEDYGWKGPVINALKLVNLQKQGKRVIMLGQTMGPYHSFRKPIMGHLLKKIDRIYPRDRITNDYLDNLGLKNNTLTDDLALLELSKQEKKERSQKYITYCPSELIYRFSKSKSRVEWINFNLYMIKELLNQFPDKIIVLLAHVLKPPTVDDRIITQELYELVKGKYGDRILLKTQDMLPYEVRNIIQESLFTISSRMHPVISSIQCGIPTIALSYSQKYWGIIGECYDLKEFILDVRFMDYEEMKEKFILLLSKIITDYELIKVKMCDNNRQAKKSISKTIQEITLLCGVPK